MKNSTPYQPQFVDNQFASQDTDKILPGEQFSEDDFVNDEGTMLHCYMARISGRWHFGLPPFPEDFKKLPLDTVTSIIAVCHELAFEELQEQGLLQRP